MYIASNEARAEALAAARIEVDPAADVGAAGGRVMGIRSFDPVPQLITATLDYIATGQAQKPPLGDAPVSLFEHLTGAALGLDPDVTATSLWPKLRAAPSRGCGSPLPTSRCGTPRSRQSSRSYPARPRRCRASSRVNRRRPTQRVTELVHALEPGD